MHLTVQRLIHVMSGIVGLGCHARDWAVVFSVHGPLLSPLFPTPYSVSLGTY